MKNFSFKDLKLPVFQAPMAGGITNPKLVSTVANFGGVGGLGFAYSSPENIEKTIRDTKELTDGYINANFFVFKEISLPDKETQRSCIEALTNLPFENKVELELPSSPFYPSLEEQLIPVWENPPSILTFHLGIPSNTIIKKAKSLGIRIGMTATNKTEALKIQLSGADFIVAQGIEAGGHRGVFDLNQYDEKLKIPELTKDLRKHTSLPIVTAGGIMNGRDIRRSIKNGATAVQMGTAFLCCPESGTSSIYKKYLLNHQYRQTTITHGFSGRPARGIENSFTDLMKNRPFLPFPAQNSLTGKLRKSSELSNNGEFISLWAGENYAEIRNIPCADLLREIKSELDGT